MQVLEVTPLGLRSAALRLRHRQTPLQFLVIPMMHMANASFYRGVTRLLQDTDIVVVEGIRGRSVISAALTATYRVLRWRRVDLVSDCVPYANLGKPLITPDVTADEFRGEWRKVPILMRAAMWPLLLAFIAARLVMPRDRLLRQVMGTELNDLPSDLDDALNEHPFTQAMTDERDRRLIEALATLHEDRSPESLTVAVVYGARHVPAIVDCLVKRGYYVRSADWLPVVSGS